MRKTSKKLDGVLGQVRAGREKERERRTERESWRERQTVRERRRRKTDRPSAQEQEPCMSMDLRHKTKQ